MIGIIWYGLGNKDKAVKQLNEIIEQYKIMNIWPGVATERTESSVSFLNLDYWTIKAAQELENRGCRCDVSYIDCNIPKEVIDNIIKPCTCGRAFSAFNVY